MAKLAANGSEIVRIHHVRQDGVIREFSFRSNRKILFKTKLDRGWTGWKSGGKIREDSTVDDAVARIKVALAANGVCEVVS